MSSSESGFIGKSVKDMYGTAMGRVIGTITDIDGTVQTVGIDCGASGLEQVPFEQMVVQGDTVIYIPKWRLESQRLLREKGLTLRRLKALMDIVSENDEMREDAEMVDEKYRSQLVAFDYTEKRINGELDTRLGKLDAQIKAVKMIIFDAKVQFKSSEISEESFEAASTQCTGVIERITHERAEISNVQRRITDLAAEVRQTLEVPSKKLQEAAVTYLGGNTDIETKLPEAPAPGPVSFAGNNMESKLPKAPDTREEPEQDWLARMEAQ